MNRKLKLTFGDFRDSFDFPEQKKPYYVYVDFDEKQLTFSSKEKLKRYLAQLENKSNKLLHELIHHNNNVMSISASLIPKFEYVQFDKILNTSFEIYKRYNFILSSHDIAIIRELNNMYFGIYANYDFLKTFIRKNDRLHYLYRQIQIDIQNFKYTKEKIENLLDSSHLKSITDKPNNELRFEIA